MLCCILHNLGEQMRKILCLRASNVQIIERDRNDSAIILDLTNSDTKDFTKLHSWAVTLGGLRVGKNKKALSVSTHAGRKVVDSIHEGKSIRVALLGLEGIDGFELTVDKRLITTCEVYEGVRDSALQGRYSLAYRRCAVTDRCKARSYFTELAVTHIQRLTVRCKLGNWNTSRECVC